MKGYLLDMWDNLTQDRRRRAQGPIHCHCCYLDLNHCPQLCQWIPPSLKFRAGFQVQGPVTGATPWHGFNGHLTVLLAK